MVCLVGWLRDVRGGVGGEEVGEYGFRCWCGGLSRRLSGRFVRDHRRERLRFYTYLRGLVRSECEDDRGPIFVGELEWLAEEMYEYVWRFDIRLGYILFR